MTDTVAVPRWVVYTQAALLGITATSFFVFGLAVGESTHVPGVVATNPVDARSTINGTVLFRKNGVPQVDKGAVLLLLPVDRRPQSRPDPEPLTPDGFVPLDNPAIDAIRENGGEVVRVDRVGQFQVTVEANHVYWLLVISRNQAAGDQKIDKQLRADLGAWLFPVEALLGDRAWDWRQIRVTGSQMELPRIEF